MRKRLGKNTSSTITTAIILFFIFDSLALGLNIWLTHRVQNQTIELNLAGRQRMLSQKMVKDFLLSPPGAATHERLEALAQTSNLFDRTLNAFRIGGVTVNTDNKLVQLAPITDRPYAHLVTDSWTLWSPLREKLFRYIQYPTAPLFLELNSELPSKTDQLLEQMNELALAIENHARSETSRIRVYQSGALIFAMLNFLAAYWLYRRRIKHLENERSLIDTLLNDMPSAMVFTDSQGKLVQANPKFFNLLGISLDEAMSYKIDELVIPSKSHENLWQLSNKAFHRATLKVERSSAIEKGQQLTIWRIEDVSDEYKEREFLSQMAFKDPLTNLNNRVAFEQRLHSINEYLEDHHISAVMFIDLDGFKQVNDIYGHHIGDEVLQEVGKRLQEQCHDHCYIARRGGDEFTLLAEQLNDEEEAKVLAKNILEALCQPYAHVDKHIDVGASIGIVMFTGKQEDMLSLIHHADKAMYLAKQKSGEDKIHLTKL